MTLVADFNVSVSVPFQRVRMLLFEQGGGIQEGVVGATDLKPAQRGAGANMSVDVPAGAAWVQIDTGTRNGLGHVYNDATANVTVTASNGTNPRIDQIILRWNETSIPTGAGNVPTLEVLTGTATAGATLDNRVGATALPNDCLRLADILVPAASSSVTTANIRDRRPFARGVRWSFNRTAGNVTLGAFGTIDASMGPRIECSGSEIQIGGGFTYAADATARLLSIRVQMDAATIMQHDLTVPASGFGSITFNAPYTPTAGSHVFTFQAAATAGAIQAVAAQPAMASIMEMVRPNASNT